MLTSSNIFRDLIKVSYMGKYAATHTEEQDNDSDSIINWRIRTAISDEAYEKGLPGSFSMKPALVGYDATMQLYRQRENFITLTVIGLISEGIFLLNSRVIRYAVQEGKGASSILASKTASVELKTAAEAVENATGDIARFASGARRSALNTLTEEEMTFIKNEFAAIGGDPNKLVFNVGGGTCYVDELDQIFVRGDIFPIEDAAHPRSTMSPRAVLAHEYYGHAANAGTPVPPGMWNDEFRASYMAAKNAPNLTDLDRYNLIQDAITRAQEAGVTIELNDFMRSILYGY